MTKINTSNLSLVTGGAGAKAGGAGAKTGGVDPAVKSRGAASTKGGFSDLLPAWFPRDGSLLEHVHGPRRTS